MSPSEIIVIISSSTAGIVSIVNAIASGWGRGEIKDKLETTNGKLDDIHVLTNSNLTNVKSQLSVALGQLSTALARIEKLETLLKEAGVDGKNHLS